MRRTLFIFILFFSTQAARAQSVEDQLREMRAELQRLRQEVNDLKQELHKSDQVAEDVSLLQAQVQEYAQTKVETSSKFPLKLFGTVVSNTFVNTGEPNWLDIPNLATPYLSTARSGSFSSSLRQTRIGGVFEGPAVGPMKMNGTFAFDFFGGIPNFQTGQVIGLPRLLYAYMRLDGKKTAVEIGQDHMILAPKNPTSLVGMSFPTLYRAGNLYLRAPLIKAEREIASGDAGQFRVEGGILAPVGGDLSNPNYDFEPPNLAGERSRTPAFQSRLSWRATPAGPYEQPQWEFGVSGHYGRERYGTSINPSWATAADLDFNVGKFGMGGEYFVGRNIDQFGGSVAQLAKSNGGFLEARFAATQRLSFNSGYGSDRLFHIAQFPSVTRSRNSAFFANGIYSFTPEFRAAFEYQRLYTTPTGANYRADRNNHFNVTFAYSF